jgi:photosystem II stability/assembly factor-like uncharacterized protein
LEEKALPNRILSAIFTAASTRLRSQPRLRYLGVLALLFALPLAPAPFVGGQTAEGQWQPVRAWPGDGAVMQIIAGPTDGDQRLYAVGAASGLMASRDGGETWASISASLPHSRLGVVRMRALAVNPENPEEIHVAVAPLTDTPRPTAYWTADGGARWQARSSLGPKRIVGIAFGPTADDLYMASGAELFAAYRPGTRQFVGDDQEMAANTISSLDPRAEVTLLSVVASGEADGVAATTFYVGTAEEGLLVLRRTADGEIRWIAPQNDEASRYVRSEARIHSFQVHPLDPDIICVGTDAGIHVSTDAGQSWNPMAAALYHETVRALLIAPDGKTLYAGLDRGVAYSADGGANWLPLGDGLGHATVYALALDGEEHPVLFAGTNRGLWRLDLSHQEVF